MVRKKRMEGRRLRRREKSGGSREIRGDGTESALDVCARVGMRCGGTVCGTAADKVGEM